MYLVVIGTQCDLECAFLGRSTTITTNTFRNKTNNHHERKTTTLKNI